MKGLKLSVLPSNIVECFNQLSFSVTLQQGPGNAVFQMDYGDGAGRTAKNDSNMYGRKYAMPGEYQVTLYASDFSGSLQVSW